MAMNLELRGLGKAYRRNGGSEPVQVLDDFNLHVEQGTFVSLLGPSGCGKSTLLRILAGLENDYRGEILWDGKPARGRDNRVGMVFQDNALFPWRTTLENIETGLEFAGIPAKERRAAARQYIDAFGLTGFESSLPRELSGGMKQRVAIARTLIMNPQVVLMDEPFGSLDCQTRNSLHAFLINLWTKRRDTILFVTHNVDEAVYLSDRILVLSPGPTHVLQSFEVAMPHPRDRTGSESNMLRREILNVLASSRATVREHAA